MSSTTSTQTKKGKSPRRENPFETISDLGASVVKNTANELTGLAGGVLDQFMGGADSEEEFDGYEDVNIGERFNKKEEKTHKPKVEKPVFRFHEHRENVTVQNEIQEIQALIEQVKQEVKMIKHSNESLMSEVQDVEKLTLSSAREKGGTYDIAFLEVILSLLRTIRLKISESGTWMQAMVSKRKKRGSAFAARTKEKGTQYSLSQELQVTRNVQ